MERRKYMARRLVRASLIICLLSGGTLISYSSSERAHRIVNERLGQLSSRFVAKELARPHAAPPITAQASVSRAGQGPIIPLNHTPEPNGKIVFASERDGNYEIYSMNPDGGGQTRLTNNPAADREPSWSPDGTKILFVSNRDGNSEIYVMDASGDGGGFNAPTRLTNNNADDEHPVWSPDGTKIAFVSSRDGNDEVYVMNANGTNQTNITNNPFDDFEPAWSPNSQKLAFTSVRDGNEEVYTMDATGTGQTNISNNASGDDRHPSWEGSKIVFQSTRDGNEEIYSMNTDGSGQTRLTNNPAIDSEPVLSADGTRIIFASNRDGNYEVYSMNANGSAQTRLTRNDEDNDFEAAVQRSAFIAPPIATQSVQFSSSTYTVNESAGSVTITVTRSGDTSGTALVDYAAMSGSASERTDFTTAIGTLRFAAGETSKTFTIFITNDAFVEPDETVNLSLSTVTTPSLGTPSVATLTIVDDDLMPSSVNPIDTPEAFVRQQYIDFLSREPETGGFNAWVGVLRNCQTGDTSCDRITVSSAFFRSPEFQIKGYFVIRFYLASLGRLPTYQEFVRDLQRINGATSNDVIANQAAYTNEFVQRSDFRVIYDALSNAAYVDRILQTAGVSISNRDQLVSDLNAGTKTRAQVLREIIETPQYAAKEFNRGFVAAEYFGYLRRDPDPQGFNAWLAFLNAHPTDFRTMVNGFVNSIEYRSRFGQP